MKTYQKWAQPRHSLGQRLAASLAAGVLIVGLIPIALLIWLPRLDARLNLPQVLFTPVNQIIAGLLITAGMAFGLWSVYVQLAHAEGTPLPMMPTQRLLVEGPFRLCRNPMTLGTLLAYGGMAVLVGSLSALCTVVVIGGLLLSYLHFVEEKELAARFGQAYEDYRVKTPFIVPRFLDR